MKRALGRTKHYLSSSEAQNKKLRHTRLITDIVHHTASQNSENNKILLHTSVKFYITLCIPHIQ